MTSLDSDKFTGLSAGEIRVGFGVPTDTCGRGYRSLKRALLPLEEMEVQTTPAKLGGLHTRDTTLRLGVDTSGLDFWLGHSNSDFGLVIQPL